MPSLLTKFHNLLGHIAVNQLNYQKGAPFVVGCESYGTHQNQNYQKSSIAILTKLIVMDIGFSLNSIEIASHDKNKYQIHHQV